MSRSGSTSQLLKLSLVAAFFGVSLALLAELYIEKFIGQILPEDSGYSRLFFFTFIFFALFMFAVSAVARKAGNIIGMYVTAVGVLEQKALPFLVMGYSPLPVADNESPDKIPSMNQQILDELSSIGPCNVARNIEGYNSFYSDRNEQPLWNIWQQNLRSVWFHRKELKVIYVLNPSVDQFVYFKNYLETALLIGDDGDGDMSEIQIIRIGHTLDENEPFTITDASGQQLPPDYENYDYVYHGLQQAITSIRQNRRLMDEYHPHASLPSVFFGSDRNEIADGLTCIDITAGQKIFSIAGAALTLNRKLRFSYVTTTQGELRFFDTNVRVAGPEG